MKKQYESIQVLRALAALGVVAFHTAGNVEAYGWITHLFPKISRYGAIGVDVFFIISGFVIALVTYGKPAGIQSARAFIKARVIRIVPLYWLLTILFACLLLLMPMAFAHARFDFFHLLTSLLFFPSLNWEGVVAPVLNVGWTLNYEAWFYVVFGIAVCVTNRPLISVAIFLSLTSLLRLIGDPSILFQFYTNPIVLEFVMGCFIGNCYARGKQVTANAALIVLCVTMVSRLLYAPIMTDDNRFIVFGLPAFAIVVVMLALENKVKWGKWMGELGAASYSLYLTHVFSIPILLKLIRKLDDQHRLSGDIICLLVVLGCVFIGFLCYRLLELPMTKQVKRRLM
jgi:peptidoglycan/LPS O-acetylase OafA/YrhL